MSEHRATIEWALKGDFKYETYSRSHTWRFEGGISVPGNAAPANIPRTVPPAPGVDPEQAFVASLSSCHMLWFLHLCADAGIVVTSYADDAEGTMQLNGDGSGQFSEVVLHPRVEFADEPARDEIEELHHRAHELCFIARSVNFPVRCEPAY